VNINIVEIRGIAAATSVAVLVLFGLALRGRSWTLWLAGYAMTIVTLVLAWRGR
jgi:hypothetical protein